VAGNTLNISSVLMCPHGGSVQIISTNTRVKVAGAPAALATDQFLIVGRIAEVGGRPCGHR